MGIVASVAQTLAEIEFFVFKHTFKHTVGHFLIPRAFNGIVKFCITVCVDESALFWCRNLGIIYRRKFERAEKIENAVLRKLSVVVKLASEQKCLVIDF